MNTGQLWGSGGTVLAGILIIAVGGDIFSIEAAESFLQSIAKNAEGFGIAVLAAVQSAKMYLQSK